MAQQHINIGASGNDRTGDSPRAAGQKINANFTELYTKKADRDHKHPSGHISDSTQAGRALLTAPDVAQQRLLLGVAAEATSLDALEDVTVAAPANGHVLRHNGVRWVNLPMTVTVGQIDAAGTRDNTTFLRGDGRWAVPAGGGGATSLDGLSDVQAATPANRQVLRFNAGVWSNAHLTAEDVAGVQPEDAGLSAFLSLSGAGLVARTGEDAYALRAIGAGAPDSIPDRRAADERYAARAHTHPVAQIEAAGDRNATTFLRGDGNWAQPPAGPSAAAMPTAGTYAAGVFVRNTAVAAGANPALFGWHRLTAGSGHVLGVDWLPFYVRTTPT